MAPQRTNLILTADVPYSERNVFVLDGFDVESDGRNRGHDLAQFQFVENRGFSSRVKPNYKRKFKMKRGTKQPATITLPIRIRICFLPNRRVKTLEIVKPIARYYNDRLNTILRLNINDLTMQ